MHVDSHGEALCPFHADTNKSLRIYQDPSRGWHCFGCGKGGSVIDMCMLWYGISFRQAVTRLDADYGLCLPLTARPDARAAFRAQEEQKKREQERRKAQEATKQAEEAYWNAFDRYLACEKLIDLNRPQKGENEASAVYASSLWLLPILRDEYERALYALETARERLLKGGGGDAAAS